MNYSELLQLAKGWGNFVSDRINIWRLRNYYSVLGSNGCGVFTEYGKVLTARQFLKSFNCKKHNDFEQAKAYAIQKYNQLQFSEDRTAMASSTLEIPLNWVIYRNKIREINKGGQKLCQG